MTKFAVNDVIRHIGGSGYRYVVVGIRDGLPLLDGQLHPAVGWRDDIWEKVGTFTPVPRAPTAADVGKEVVDRVNQVGTLLAVDAGWCWVRWHSQARSTERLDALTVR